MEAALADRPAPRHAAAQVLKCRYGRGVPWRQLDAIRANGMVVKCGDTGVYILSLPPFPAHEAEDLTSA